MHLLARGASQKRYRQSLIELRRIAVLASGRGTDFQAIADHWKLGILRNVELVGLICNHEDAPVIKRAKESGVDTFFLEGVTGAKFPGPEKREEARIKFDVSCVDALRGQNADLVVLAGFDQIVSKTFVDAFAFKILNIHPAYDLKRFGGKNMVGAKVHEQVLRSRVPYSGCTIHFVTNDIDGGPVLLKRRVEISNNETPESLEKKILRTEHLAYPEAIQLLADDRVKLDETGRKCFVDRYSDGWDIDWDQRQQRYIATVLEKE